MDIEEYLRQKRSLEAKKELLEAKERITKEERRKSEPPKSDAFRDPAREPRPSRPEQEPAPKQPELPVESMFRRLIIWNVIILVIVVGAIGSFFFLNTDEPAQPSIGEPNPITGAAIANVGSASNTTSQPQPSNASQTKTTQTKETYPGPEFTFTLEDEELGLFEQPTGKLGGEHLVINRPYYEDIVLKLFNDDSTTMVCFIDREVTVDQDFDNNAELEDINLDMFVEEVDKKTQELIRDTAPGTFEQGTYTGVGKVTVQYEARCYYCLDLLCEEYDPNGETKKKRLLKFSVNPPVINQTTNST